MTEAHTHAGTHAHPHAHAHGGEENPYAGQGAVLLDIGGDVGAIVVEMPTEMVGVEIEVRRVDDAAPGLDAEHAPHVAVVARAAPEATVPSLVFPELREGTYALSHKGGGPAQATVTVTGSEVTHLTWPR